MTFRTIAAIAATSLASVLVLGCSGDDESTGEEANVMTPEFEGGGQEAHAQLDYPAGPFGIKVGSVIENFKFRGYADPQAGANIGVLQLIELAEFYNPTGDGVYGPGSPFGEGNPKPKAIMYNVGSVWCPPCNEEARSVLPGEHATYKPQGGLIISQLQDGPSPGEPAKLIHLSNWINAYDVEYPIFTDPSGKMGPLFDADAFPANFIIRTRDMVIIEADNGVPRASFWKKFEATLAE
jgi:hypothetical protein